MSEMNVDETEVVPGGTDESSVASSDPWNEFLQADEVDEDNPQQADEPALEGDADTDENPSTQISQEPAKVTAEPTPVVTTPPPSVEAPVETAPVADPSPQTPPVTSLSAQDLATLRGNWETQLANEYAIGDEDALKFVTETGTMLPALAAKLHVRIFDQVMQTVAGMINNQVPQLIETVQSSRKVANEAEEAFFSEWEELRSEKAKVMEIARTYRQLNPNATPADFRKAVGMQTWMVLGKSPAELVVKLNGGQIPGTVQPTPPKGKVLHMPPLQPTAGAGIPSTARPAPGGGNPFTEMANTWYEELE